MQQRTIFPNVTLIKKTLAERFLVTLREIYRNNPTYTYKDDEMQTSIYISPSYATVTTPGKKPRLIIKPGGYAFSLTDTLFHNMSGEATNSDGIIAGYTYKKMMAASATIMVDAFAEEESSDIADELVMLTSFACRGMFGQNAIAIRGAEVSPTEVLDQTQNLYRTAVAVSFEFAWEGEITSNAPSILQTDATVESVSDTGSTRMPGIEVYRLAIQQQDL